MSNITVQYILVILFFVVVIAVMLYRGHLRKKRGITSGCRGCGNNCPHSMSEHKHACADKPGDKEVCAAAEDELPPCYRHHSAQD